MASAKVRNAFGYGALGLAAGVFVLPFFYLVTVRTRIAVRGDPLWATLFLVLALGPAIAMALYGMRRPTDSAGEAPA